MAIMALLIFEAGLVAGFLCLGGVNGFLGKGREQASLPSAKKHLGGTETIGSRIVPPGRQGALEILFLFQALHEQVFDILDTALSQAVALRVIRRS